MTTQHSMPLVERLQQQAHRHHAAFYTPGHKRGQASPQSLREWWGEALFQADLPELPELDNLFTPQGVIAEAQALAAEAFGADRTWFLVNGSTSGVIAAIAATCAPGDKIIMPRTIHQSVVTGLIFTGAIPIFVTPAYDLGQDLVGSITPESVMAALEQHPDAQAVLMVYPTYEGLCGDVATIATIAHHHDIPLLVDEAHGAHFHFHPELPPSALSLGADLVVQSIHKVLSSLTQSAMLHTRGDRLNPHRLDRVLRQMQSSSPSNLLLASLDAARHQMVHHGYDLMTHTLDLAKAARSRLAQIPGIIPIAVPISSTLGCITLDPTRLTLDISQLGITGFAADRYLDEDCQVLCELPSLRHLTFIISLGNTMADIQTLEMACHSLVRHSLTIPKELAQKLSSHPNRFPWLPIASLTPREAFFAPTDRIAIEQACDRISAEVICPYPPGIPVLMPGEQITPEALAYLQDVLQAGGQIIGCQDTTLRTLVVTQTEPFS